MSVGIWIFGINICQDCERRVCFITGYLSSGFVINPTHNPYFTVSMAEINVCREWLSFKDLRMWNYRWVDCPVLCSQSCYTKNKLDGAIKGVINIEFVKETTNTILSMERE